MAKRHPKTQVLLFHTTVSFLLEHKENAIASVQRALETISHAREISCIWYVDSNSICLEEIAPQLFHNLEQLKLAYKKNGVQVVDGLAASAMTMSDINALIQQCSAYYGNPGMVAHMCRNQRLPVMIQSAEIG